MNLKECKGETKMITERLILTKEGALKESFMVGEVAGILEE